MKNENELNEDKQNEFGKYTRKKTLSLVEQNMAIEVEDNDNDNEDVDNDEHMKEEDENTNRSRFLRRSKTLPTTAGSTLRLNKSLVKENSILMQSCNSFCSTLNLKLNLNPDRLKAAKDEVERAIKVSPDFFSH